MRARPKRLTSSVIWSSPVEARSSIVDLHADRLVLYGQRGSKLGGKPLYLAHDGLSRPPVADLPRAEAAQGETAQADRVGAKLARFELEQ